MSESSESDLRGHLSFLLDVSNPWCSQPGPGGLYRSVCEHCSVVRPHKVAFLELHRKGCPWRLAMEASVEPVVLTEEERADCDARMEAMGFRRGEEKPAQPATLDLAGIRKRQRIAARQKEGTTLGFQSWGLVKKDVPALLAEVEYLADQKTKMGERIKRDRDECLKTAELVCSQSRKICEQGAKIEDSERKLARARGNIAEQAGTIERLDQAASTSACLGKVVQKGARTGSTTRALATKVRKMRLVERETVDHRVTAW